MTTIRDFFRNMDAKDKGKLLRFSFIVGVVLVCVASILFRKAMPGYAVVLLTLLAQQLWAIPSISGMYMSIQGYQDSWQRFIPLWSEYRILPKVAAITVLTVSIIQWIMIVLCVLPVINPQIYSSTLTPLLGEEITMNLSFYLLMWTIVVYIVLNLVRGSGFIALKREVDIIYRERFGKIPMRTSENVQYLLFFIPTVRFFSLLMLHDRLRKMCMVENSAALDTKQFEQEEGVYTWV